MVTLNVRQLGWCILLEPVGDSKEPMWFSEWLKHRPDQPKHILEWLENAGVRPGESAPMFVPANRACMIFQHKGMAEKTAEKIEAWCPVDFAGKLHVMPFDEVLDDVEG